MFFFEHDVQIEKVVFDVTSTFSFESNKVLFDFGIIWTPKITVSLASHVLKES